MPPTNYLGEHLLPGKLGHALAILAFTGALFSMFSYWRSAQTEMRAPASSTSWLRMGRNGFVLHSAAVFGIFLTLYYIIAGHFFEYHYAWEHSNKSLPKKYLLSCFWEGQQGSFLLWSFWHCVLGLFVMLRAKALESRTMAIISGVQTLLATFLLGFYLGPEVKIGATPFALLRHQMGDGAPIFQQANYLSFIQDGNGLNPLLQNYWMVIHPPILFLGFAATLIPFAYTAAALWKGEYKTFIQPALKWSLFTGAVLGTGIMMGGAWAYESLNFGGYWAWDPVENASLVPWLTVVAGLHTLIVYKATGRALASTAIFFLLTYALIWYSTFLTRTGILGDTSVHAFTGEGKSLTGHLLFVIGAVLLTGVGLLARRWKSLPRVKGEERLTSREFWMAIGSFVLLLSAVQIIITTSVPVWAPAVKAVSGRDIAPPTNPVAHYNSIQVWVAVILATFSSAVLYFRFQKSDMKAVGKRWAVVGTGALALTLALGFWQHIPLSRATVGYALLLFAASFSVVASAYYAFAVQKTLRKAGAALTHFGFAVLLLGILFSSYNKRVISENILGINLPLGDGLKPEEAARESRENVMLFRDVPVAMGDYFVTYKGDSLDTEYLKDKRSYYSILFQRLDAGSREVTERFTLRPDAFINPRGQDGLSANPDAKHYWTRDIFTYVSSIADPARKADTSEYRSFTLRPGDSAFLSKAFIVFGGFTRGAQDGRYTPQPGDLALTASLAVYNLDGLVDTLRPIYYIRDRFEAGVEDTLAALALQARISGVVPDGGAVQVQIREADVSNDFVVLKAIEFPMINLVWAGTILMVSGFGLSLANRAAKKRSAPARMPTGSNAA